MTAPTELSELPRCLLTPSLYVVVGYVQVLVGDRMLVKSCHCMEASSLQFPYLNRPTDVTCCSCDGQICSVHHLGDEVSTAVNRIVIEAGVMLWVWTWRPGNGVLVHAAVVIDPSGNRRMFQVVGPVLVPSV